MLAALMWDSFHAINAASVFRNGEEPVIKAVKGGYVVTSETGKRLSRRYKTRAEAEKRLRQIEYFANKGK